MAAKKKRRKRGRMSGRVVKVRIVGRCFRRADGSKVCLKSKKRRKKSRRKKAR